MEDVTSELAETSSSSAWSWARLSPLWPKRSVVWAQPAPSTRSRALPLRSSTSDRRASRLSSSAFATAAVRAARRPLTSCQRKATDGPWYQGILVIEHFDRPVAS